MKILVTGASGFLGRHVVKALLAAGHSVRALVRPETARERLVWGGSVAIFQANLQDPPDLLPAFDGVDALIHLAAVMSGSGKRRFEETVSGTQHLFKAMQRSSTRRLILCSSLSVYDWTASSERPDESLRLGSCLDTRGGYAAAKRRQEVLARELAQSTGVELTILRPGFIWGPGNACPPWSVGRRLGPFQLVFNPSRRPGYCNVANVSDCFRAALEEPHSIGEAINIIDSDRPTAWAFFLDHRARGMQRAFPVPVPYFPLRAAMGLAGTLGRALGKPQDALPDLFRPETFFEGIRAYSYDTTKRRKILKSHVELTYASCLELTYSQRSHCEAIPEPRTES